jgi:REP element-mobilizing transposase RayT
LYFVTFTIVEWIDLFIRDEYRKIILDSLHYCRKHKGLEIYAWVIMTSHIHLIIGRSGEHDISSLVRDFKKFTSKKLIEEIELTHESRKVWMLKKFSFEAVRNKRGKDYILW